MTSIREARESQNPGPEAAGDIDLAAEAQSAILEKLFQQAHAGMAIADSERRWIKVNPALCEMLGYSEQELIGHDPWEFTHPDDVPSPTSSAHLNDGIPTSGLDLEKRYVTKDGAVVWALVTISVMVDAVTGEHFHLAQVQDITLRKRAELAIATSEARWRTLLAHLREIVLLADADGRLSYASPSIEDWLGYSAEEVVGRRLSQIVHPDDRRTTTEAFADVRPGAAKSVSHRMSHKDGSWHTLQSTLVCLRDDPAVQAVLIASIDVTDQLTIEDERERMELERRVSHRLEAVGQLAAGIAHEINTPLQFVGDSVSFLKDAVDDLLELCTRYRELMWADEPIGLDERRARMLHAEQDADLEYLYERIPSAFERTNEGISRVRSIVQAMKRFSHASSTEFALADLNEGITTTLEVCRNEYKYHAEIVLDLAPSLPLVTCNAGEINEVFLNLILNAAQAIAGQRAGTGTLGQIAITTRAEEGSVIVEVADDGPGIPPELQDRIYEPFFTTKPVGQGTGQGLALARTTINRHHGSLECTSAPDRGTTFVIRLPLEQSTGDGNSAAASS